MTINDDEWRVIHNPITGEVLTFLERTPEQVVFDVEFPPHGVPVVSHSHPGSESFQVLDGQLRLTVGGDVHDLGPGETLTVHDELHGPSNVSDRPVRVRVTCAELPEFAEPAALDRDDDHSRWSRSVGGQEAATRELLATGSTSTLGPAWSWATPVMTMRSETN
jgi:quercetin dioxygenase-like cupin family protein